MMWLVITFIVYYLGLSFCHRYQHPLNNPLLLCVLAMIGLLLLTNTSYSQYYKNGPDWLTYLLQPAVVALACPLYDQLPMIKRRWRPLILTCSVSSILAMSSGAGLAILFGLPHEIVASILPKSVTTPIAIAISAQLNGIPAITTVMVTFAGLFGSILGYPILRFVRVRDPIARGLAIGCCSHALGTSIALQKSEQDGAFSSLALVLSGILTAIIAPYYGTWFLQYFI